MYIQLLSIIKYKCIFHSTWGCPKSNERYTKCGSFDKLNHRNANLLDSFKKNHLKILKILCMPT